MKERILIIDGAMGTMIQRYKLNEADYRGERFKDWPSDVKGNNDLLCLTQPQIIKEFIKNILKQVLILLKPILSMHNVFHWLIMVCKSLAYEINFAAAKIAREAVNEFNGRKSGNQSGLLPEHWAHE